MTNDSVRTLKQRGNGGDGEAPVETGRIVISFLNTEPPSLRVSGLPTNFHEAFDKLQATLGVVANMYVERAMKGELDGNFNIKQSDLVIKDSSLVGLDGKKL